MRTRIDIADEQRVKLLKLAAERGERTCSGVVQEALTMYFDQKERPSMVVLEAQPVLRADTRTERARLVVSWVWEEAMGFVTLARSFRSRLLGRPAAFN